MIVSNLAVQNMIIPRSEEDDPEGRAIIITGLFDDIPGREGRHFQLPLVWSSADERRNNSAQMAQLMCRLFENGLSSLEYMYNNPVEQEYERGE